MPKELKISKSLALPLDAVTQKIAWLGRTGSGKTFACKKMVEQMLHLGAQVVILDGAGGWAGLRLGPKSFDVPVLGGLYGDIPLEPSAGALIADVVVGSGTSIILDVSQMLDSERTRFATMFAQQFFQRKKAKPSAVHLVLEECQDFVPQNSEPGEQRMLHEFQRIAKQGRPHGIGVSFLSQRPQEISKKALNQVECVFAFQMTGAHERKALQYWLNDKGASEKLEDILPRLEIGAPHVWSPQWLKISRVVRILPIETLDTSRTPKVGERAFVQKKLEPINLKELTVMMAETVERAKLEDPKTLRTRIAELEKALAKKPAEVPAKVDWDKVDRWVLARLEDGIKRIRLEVSNALVDMRVLNKGGFPAPPPRGTMFNALASQKQPTDASEKMSAMFEASKPKAPHPQAVPVPRASKGSLPKGERAILKAAAQYEDEGVTRPQLTALTGYKRSSRDAYVSRLSSAKLVELEGNRVIATAAGMRELGDDYEPLPVGAALLQHWLKELPEGEGRILEFVAASQPHAITRDQIEEYTGYKRSSRDAYISRLSSRQLVQIGKEGVRLAEALIG